MMVVKGSYFMATKSILKNVTIRDNYSAKRLVTALEFAQNEHGKVLNVPKAEIASVDDVKNMLGIK